MPPTLLGSSIFFHFAFSILLTVHPRWFYSDRQDAEGITRSARAAAMKPEAEPISSSVRWRAIRRRSEKKRNNRNIERRDIHMAAKKKAAAKKTAAKKPAAKKAAAKKKK